MATVHIRYVGPIDEIDLPLIGRSVKRGEVFEVDEQHAGHAPSGTPGEDDYDPGEGLLAQVGNYEAATVKKSSAGKGDA
jgi:hypothetical protein